MSLLMWVWLFAGPVGVVPPTVTQEDHLLIGQKEAFGVTTSPTIGGTQSW
jgi:hypothetical protein